MGGDYQIKSLQIIIITNDVSNKNAKIMLAAQKYNFHSMDWDDPLLPH